MRESTVTAKGQTTLPRDVRAALGLQAGDRVRYVILEGDVRLLRARPVRELKGLLAQPDRAPVPLEAMDEAIVRAATEGAEPGR